MERCPSSNFRRCRRMKPNRVPHSELQGFQISSGLRWPRNERVHAGIFTSEVEWDFISSFVGIVLSESLTPPHFPCHKQWLKHEATKIVTLRLQQNISAVSGRWTVPATACCCYSYSLANTIQWPFYLFVNELTTRAYSKRLEKEGVSELMQV